MRADTVLVTCMVANNETGVVQPLAEVARLAHEPGISLYTDIFGIAELRSAIADHFSADYKGKVAAQNVCVTAGCNQAFAAAIMQRKAVAAKTPVKPASPVVMDFELEAWLMRILS